MNKTQLLKTLGLYDFALYFLFLKERMTFNFNESSKLTYKEHYSIQNRITDRVIIIDDGSTDNSKKIR